MVARCQPHLAADAAGNTPSMSSPIDGQIWVLDQQGNWDQFISDLDGASGGIDTYQVRDHSVANEITDIDKEPTFGPASSDWIDPTYDAAGNMTKRPDPDDADDASDADTITFDAWNRLVKISDATTGTVAIYYYDGLGRRIAKFVDGTHLYDYYYNESWQVVEVRKNGDEDPLEQFAYDINYIDALAIRWYDNDTDAEYDGDSGSDPTDNDDGEQYYLYDASFNVIALLDKAGTPLERYRYTPYGERIVMNASFVEQSGTSYGQQRGFQGLLHDEESGLIENRKRMLDPLTGRFLQRDPSGYADGMNAYAAYHVMWGVQDPSGMFSVEGLIGDAVDQVLGSASGCRSWEYDLSKIVDRYLTDTNFFTATKRTKKYLRKIIRKLSVVNAKVQFEICPAGSEDCNGVYDCVEIRGGVQASIDVTANPFLAWVRVFDALPFVETSARLGVEVSGGVKYCALQGVVSGSVTGCFSLGINFGLDIPVVVDASASISVKGCLSIPDGPFLAISVGGTVVVPGFWKDDVYGIGGQACWGPGCSGSRDLRDY